MKKYSVELVFKLLACCFLTASVVSCEKNEFRNISFKASYQYDGECRSFTENDIFNYPDAHTLNIHHRNDTTFFCSPRHIWWDDHFFYGYLNIIDTSNQVLPNQKTEYDFKPGVIYPETAISKQDFSENIIIAYTAPRKSVEIISGHCSIEKIRKKLSLYDQNSKMSKADLVGVKICFETRWREIESGEEHEIKNGVLLFSKDAVVGNAVEIDPWQ